MRIAYRLLLIILYDLQLAISDMQDSLSSGERKGKSPKLAVSHCVRYEFQIFNFKFQNNDLILNASNI